MNPRRSRFEWLNAEAAPDPRGLDNLTVMASMADAIQQFREAIFAAGIEPPKNIVADGKIHRFPTNGTRKDDAGWYVLHLDGLPAGAFGDWRSNMSEMWCAASETMLTAEQRAELQQFYEGARRARSAKQQRIWKEAADKARRLWAEAVEATNDFPYLRGSNLTGSNATKVVCWFLWKTAIASSGRCKS
jgi:putative DNA primase/helicase